MQSSNLSCHIAPVGKIIQLIVGTPLPLPSKQPIYFSSLHYGEQGFSSFEGFPSPHSPGTNQERTEDPKGSSPCICFYEKASLSHRKSQCNFLVVVMERARMSAHQGSSYTSATKSLGTVQQQAFAGTELGCTRGWPLCCWAQSEPCTVNPHLGFRHHFYSVSLPTRK